MIAAGKWEVLHGDGSLSSGVLVRFTDRDTALGWYNSPQYQAALKIRLRSAKTRVVMLTGHSEG